MAKTSKTPKSWTKNTHPTGAPTDRPHLEGWWRLIKGCDLRRESTTARALGGVGVVTRSESRSAGYDAPRSFSCPMGFQVPS